MKLFLSFPFFAAAFAVLGEARSVVPNVCILPPDQGPCRGGLPRFYHNAKEGKCEEFAYGGCGGNGNRFKTEAECERACGKKSMCPQICPLIYKPVCGSDGKTYSNLCQLKVEECNSGEEIFVVKEGKCNSGCEKACSFIYYPVCGSNGKTYPSKCVLEIETCKSNGDITLDHEGECEEQKRKSCYKPCPRIYRPVCGSDGKTYPNTCEFEVAACLANEEISVDHKGKCQDEKPQN